MKTKRLMKTLGVLGILIVFQSAHAQKERNQKANPQNHIEKLEQHITLTDVQKQQIISVRMDLRKNRKAQTQQNPTQAKREDMGKMHHSKYAEILTVEQLDTLKSALKENRENQRTFRTEWNGYLGQEFQPELRTQRIAFESSLTAEEKAILAKFNTKKGKRKLHANQKDFKVLEPILENHQVELARVEALMKAKYGDRIRVQGQLLQEKYGLEKNPADRLFGAHFETKFLLLTT